jgi:hypothetical protein
MRSQVGLEPKENGNDKKVTCVQSLHQIYVRRLRSLDPHADLISLANLQKSHEGGPRRLGVHCDPYGNPRYCPDMWVRLAYPRSIELRLAVASMARHISRSPMHLAIFTNSLILNDVLSFCTSHIVPAKSSRRQQQQSNSILCCRRNELEPLAYPYFYSFATRHSFFISF